VATVLDCSAEALRSPPRSNARHRIEHCGAISEDLIDKVAGLGVIPVPHGRFIGEIGDDMKHALDEHRTGTLREDMLADFVVLDRDIFDIDRDGIRENGVVATVTGARWSMTTDSVPVPVPVPSQHDDQRPSAM